VAAPRVVLFTLGGTIAMSGTEGGGVVARLSGAELMAGLGRLDTEVDVRDRHAVPSADLSFSAVLDVVAAADQAVALGAAGIVLTQGTDTLEESAFLVDAVWTHDAPFVVTGAMRNPTLPGADGPANVLAAVRVAAAVASRGRGALVVLNDEIHAARLVRKAHSLSPATFSSPDAGPMGHVVEGVPRFLARVPRMRPVTGFVPTTLASTRVALYTMTLDDDGVLLDSVATMHQGLVVAGFGVGHVPSALAPVLGELATTMPVVLTSRTGAGSVLQHTYGAVGSERDLRERGLISGGFLHPYKARVLLRLLVAAGASTDEITAAFTEYG
jgi:L-asparaginase